MGKCNFNKNFSYPPDNYAQVLKAKQYAPDYDRKKIKDPDTTVFQSTGWI
jgi:hypothetical protein